MLPIHGLYEVALRVKNLPQAEAFYCNILGLEVGLRDKPRKWVFLRVGGQAGMLVLQEDPDHWSPQHLAFTVQEADLERAVAALRAHGVSVEGPLTHDWMPAKSAYFSDPDEHDLELCAPLTNA